MAQRAILLSSRSLNGREFPQSILKFLTATEDEAKQYLMDCIDNDIKENMNLNVLDAYLHHNHLQILFHLL